MQLERNYTVSVVILTKNSVATVRKTLDSVFSQSRLPDEVVVVDGSSTDGTIESMKNYPVRIVSEQGLGFGYARNLGVREAKGDLIFFIDSDCYAEPQWIESALHHFADSEIVGVTGPTRLWNTSDGVARFVAYIGGRMKMSTEVHEVKTAATMNLALRREAIFAVGEFDPNLVRGEDTEITFKITKKNKIIYEPKAVVWFRGSPNMKIASRKCINHFIGAGQLVAKYGYNPAFEKFHLMIRGILLIIALISVFLTPWYIPTFLFLILLTEFIYKICRTYNTYRDRCVVYYVFFFTLWSLAGLAMAYGIVKQIRFEKRQKIASDSLYGNR